MGSSLKFALFGFGINYGDYHLVFIDFKLPKGALQIIPCVGRNGIKQPIFALQFLFVQGIHVRTDPCTLQF